MAESPQGVRGLRFLFSRLLVLAIPTPGLASATISYQKAERRKRMMLIRPLTVLWTVFSYDGTVLYLYLSISSA